VQPLDVRPNRADVDTAAVHPHLVGVGDGNQDVHIILGIGGFRFRPVHLHARFLDKGSSHDEEDQHDEHHVQHGRQVDLGFVFRCRFLFPTAHCHFAS